MFAALTAIFAFLLFCGELWVSKSPERKKEAEDEATQKVRQAIVSGDVDVINDVSDKLLSVSEAGASNLTGQHSDESIAERINNVLKP